MEYQARFKSVFHGTIDIISLIDIDYTILMVNTAYEKLLKKSSKECIGQKCYKIIRNREIPCEDCPMLNISNKYMDDEALVIPIEDENVSLTRHPVYDNMGKIVGVFEIGRIITKELRMEKELQHHGRLKIMGELAASIVHEIKNPLVGIGLMAVSIMERMKEKNLKDEIYQDVKSIFREVKRLEKLLQNLMDFGKPTPFITKREDIHTPINHTLKLLKGRFRAGKIQIKKEFNSKIPHIMIDLSKMQQVFLNIFINAIEAMPDGGEIKIKTDISQTDMVDTIKKSWIEIIIQDSGIGIKDEDLPYVFDPFFSKSTQRTGLGLSIVSRLIESHNGFVIIESQSGKGTKVKIYLLID